MADSKVTSDVPATLRAGVLALDPSLTCTGYAVLADNGTDDGEIVEAGIMRPDAGTTSLEDRVQSLVDQAQLVLVRARDLVLLDEVAVEGPAEHIRSEHVRSAATLPNYGVVVGAMRWGLQLPPSVRHIRLIPVTSWARGSAACAADKSGTYKLPRVSSVCALYGLEPKQLGPKTTAGNVADAILLGRYVVSRMRNGGFQDDPASQNSDVGDGGAAGGSGAADHGAERAPARRKGRGGPAGHARGAARDERRGKRRT